MVTYRFDEIEFEISGTSYVGKPRNGTMMYISKKVSYLVDCLYGIEKCLIFAEHGMTIDSTVSDKNKIIYSNNPQFEYSRYAQHYAHIIFEKEKNAGYALTPEGYYVGSNVQLGRNVYIEPTSVIGPNVKIGDGAIILAGSKIKNSIIGDNFLCNENAVIGNYSFTMAEGINNENVRIPALGRVIIGNNVEVGPSNNISRGACGDTILEDNVKLGGVVDIGHEAYIHKNVIITAGVIVAGFCEIGEHSYLGVNSSIKNRIKIGDRSTVGMAANVIRTVGSDDIVVGNPANSINSASIKEDCCLNNIGQ